MCSHREAAYSSDTHRWTLQNSERAQDQCIVLPLYVQMTEGDLQQVVDTLKAAIGRTDERRDSQAC